MPHTATAKDGSWDTGILNKGDTKTITFDKAGDYQYYCKVHPNMIARRRSGNWKRHAARPRGRKPGTRQALALRSAAAAGSRGSAPRSRRLWVWSRASLHTSCTTPGQSRGRRCSPAPEAPSCLATIGFVLTIPMLLRLRRRFGTWAAPGVALALFAVAFAVSTLWIGPAIRGDGGGSSAEQPFDHASHHPGQQLHSGEKEQSPCGTRMTAWAGGWRSWASSGIPVLGVPDLPVRGRDLCPAQGRRSGEETDALEIAKWCSSRAARFNTWSSRRFRRHLEGNVSGPQAT